MKGKILRTQMESEISQDNGTFTWCPICENQVSEKYKDTEKLLDHIRTSHPPVIQENHLNVNQKDRFQLAQKIAKKLQLPRRKRKSSTKVARKRVAESIEKNFIRKKMFCPVCNQDVVPIVFSKSWPEFEDCSFGAICFLGCWPLCFIPLMINRDKSLRMVCPLCGYDYGTYDVRNSTENAAITENAPTVLCTPEIQPKSSITTMGQQNVHVDLDNNDNGVENVEDGIVD